MADTDVSQAVLFCRGRLREEADPVFQKGQLHFFKSGSQEYEAIENYGVRGTKLKRIEQELYRQIKLWPAARRVRLCESLWKSGKLEEGVLAIYLCRRFARHFGPEDFQRFEKWLDRYVHNWAHADGLASWLLAACIGNRPGLRLELAGWTTSRNRWKRRAAAVSLLQEAKAGRHTDFIFEIAEALRGDADDMVRKGVGWLLKESYPRRNREVVEFLGSRPAPFARAVLRYAAEKMTAADRGAALGQTAAGRNRRGVNS